MSAAPSILFLTGSTASGKTAVALEAAQMLNAEIVSADAYQVYKQLPLLTAAPSIGEQKLIPHHLVGFLDVMENWDATLHYHKSIEAIREINNKGKTALIVGGSGLYVKFLSHGLSDAPPSSEELRSQWESLPLEELAAKLQELDPEGASQTNLSNRRYVTRNLEIVVLGGKPLSYWKQNWKGKPSGPGFYLDWETSTLDERIKNRSHALMYEGAVEEIAALPPENTLSSTAKKTLGLSLIQSFLKGALPLSECEDLLYLRTRQYAKRQRTWLRRESWLTPLPCMKENYSPSDLANSILTSLA